MHCKEDQLVRDLIKNLNNRIRIEHQPEGWAIIIDNEVYTWATTRNHAYDFALRLIKAGI